MTPQETLNFFDQQFNRSTRGIAVAIASNNWHLARVNYGQKFKCRLMGGLISWRLRRDPTEFLQNAITVATEGNKVLSSLSESLDVVAALPVGKAALLAELVGVSFKPGAQLMAELSLDSQLDILLTTARPLQSTEPHQIAQLWEAKRTSLAAETYHNYFKILSSRGNFEKLEELTREGERLFAKRIKDAFYMDSEQTEGGGSDNSLVVDYRLAVALKRAGMPSNSLHSWEW